MVDMLSDDEGYYAADAVTLIEAPRFVPFFPDNNGREGGWMIVLAAFMVGLGPTPFAARVAAGFVGVLTVAATYRLGKELFDDAIGLGAAAGMAVLYWPVHMSHLALRANLLPCLGALSLSLLLTAKRRSRTRCWVMAGLATGLLGYTYNSAQVWVVLELGMLLFWCLRPGTPMKRRTGVHVSAQRRARAGAFLALAIGLMVLLPLAAYVARHPGEVLLRATESATIGPGSFWVALESWRRAWFVRGDALFLQNLPGRPIFEWASGTLFILGIAGLLAYRKLREGLLLLALAGLSILPSLLSEYPPHFLRAIGLTVPIALVLGAGAQALAQIMLNIPHWRQLLAQRSPALGATVPAALFCVSAIMTHTDFSRLWLNLPQTPANLEYPVESAIQMLRRMPPGPLARRPVYFVPFEVTHPLIRFAKYGLSPRRVGAFKAEQCLVVPVEPALYTLVRDKAPTFRATLARWGEVQAQADTGQAGSDITSLSMTPKVDRLRNHADRVWVFGDAIEMRTDAPSVSNMQPDQQGEWTLRLRATGHTDHELSVFVHVYAIDVAGKIDDQHILAQGDKQMCPSYPVGIWQPDEVIVEPYNVHLPPRLPAGRYAVVVGVYEVESGVRFRLSGGVATDLNSTEATDYALLQTIQIKG